MKHINLKIDTINILGIYFSYNELIAIQKKKKKKNNGYMNIQGALKLWIMKKLTIEGRIVIFKTLAIY